MQGDRKKTKRQYDGPSLSLVFPAYNEQDNIVELLDRAAKVAERFSKDYEVIVVDDGSRDQTVSRIMQAKVKNQNIKLLRHKTNKGYGSTVWDGLKAAKKELVFFSDSDLQFNLMELEKFLYEIKNFDVAIGYRKPRRDPFMRKMNAFGWKILLYLFFHLKAKDVDCAFKLFKKSVLDSINVTSEGAMFSAELLIVIKKQGFKIVERPVSHFPRKAGRATGAKLNVIRKAFAEMWSLYLTDRSLVRSRSLLIYFLATIALFASRFLFVSNSNDFFDSTQYSARVVMSRLVDVISTGHPPFHPFYNLLAALFYKMHLASNGIMAATLPSVVFGSLSVVFVFLLIRRLFNGRIAWLASIFYALSSFVWISQITVLVDPTEHCFYFLSLYLLTFAFDGKKSRQYLYTLLAGLSFGLAVFTHTQVVIWTTGILAVVMMANRNWSLRGFLSLIYKTIIFILATGLFIGLYLPLLIYASSHRTDIVLNLRTYRAALKYLLFSNVSDRSVFEVSTYLRYILTLASSLAAIIGVLGLVKMLKREASKAWALIIWFASSLIASMYIYENLYGRALIIGLVPIYIFAAYFITSLKSSWRYILMILMVAQLLIVSLPAILRYKNLPAANESLANMQFEANPGGVFISSNVTRTWSDYKGRFVNFGDVGVGAHEAEEFTSAALNAQKSVYVSSDAIFHPYRRYDGVLYDLRSVNVGSATGHGNLLGNLFNSRSFEIAQNSTDFRQFDYRILINASDRLTASVQIAQNSRIVLGRIQSENKPVGSISVNTYGKMFCNAEDEDISRLDALLCLKRILLGQKRPEDWTFTDQDGWFYLPTKLDKPDIVLGLQAADIKSPDKKLRFIDQKIIDLKDSSYLGRFDQEVLENFLKSTDQSFYAVSAIADSKVVFDVYAFDFKLPLTDKIEGENLSGEVSEVVSDPLASNSAARLSSRFNSGYVLSGPYINLELGSYEVSFRVKSTSTQDKGIVFDVVSDSGRMQLARKSIKANEIGKDFTEINLDFTVNKNAPGTEFRVNAPSNSQLSVDYVKLTKKD